MAKNIILWIIGIIVALIILNQLGIIDLSQLFAVSKEVTEEAIINGDLGSSSNSAGLGILK